MRLNRPGFTLIEVVAAVAVAALILTATYGVVTSTVRAQRRTEDFLGVYKEGAALMSLLDEDLTGFIVRFSGPGEDKGAASAGEKMDEDETLNFVLNVSGTHPGFSFTGVGWDPQAGTKMAEEIGYTVEGGENEQLLLYRRCAPIEGEAVTGGIMTLVTDRLLSWKIELYNGETWEDEWDDPREIPLSVKITFELPGDNEARIRFSRQIAIPAAAFAGEYSIEAEMEEGTKDIVPPSESEAL